VALETGCGVSWWGPSGGEDRDSGLERDGRGGEVGTGGGEGKAGFAGSKTVRGPFLGTLNGAVSAMGEWEVSTEVGGGEREWGGETGQMAGLDHVVGALRGGVGTTCGGVKGGGRRRKEVRNVYRKGKLPFRNISTL